MKRGTLNWIHRKGECGGVKITSKQGYQADDLVGKTGLEKVLENKLRGEKGGRVFIEDEKGKEIKNVAKKKQKKEKMLR